MNYATWKLNFTDPNYGTGPEDAILDQGYGAQAAWIQGEAQSGGTILGYLTEPVDESELTTWEVKNITEAEALSFCQAINPEAFVAEDGRISTPFEGLIP